MAARANSVVDRLAEVIGPRGVEPALQPQFEHFSLLCLYDLHSLRCQLNCD